MQMFGLEFLGGPIIDSSRKSSTFGKFQILTPQLTYVLIVYVPSRTKKNLLLAGKKRVAIFGSTEGESSDDSLVDLVSAKGQSLAELPKYRFYH